jgi:hypothetical protein
MQPYGKNVSLKLNPLKGKSTGMFFRASQILQSSDQNSKYVPMHDIE